MVKMREKITARRVSDKVQKLFDLYVDNVRRLQALKKMTPLQLAAAWGGSYNSVDWEFLQVIEKELPEDYGYENIFDFRLAMSNVQEKQASMFWILETVPLRCAIINYVKKIHPEIFETRKYRSINDAWESAW